MISMDSIEQVDPSIAGLIRKDLETPEFAHSSDRFREFCLARGDGRIRFDIH